MFVTLKTLQQQTFKIEVEPEELVKSLKEKIEKEKGPDVFPANGQKLIYAGKILEDDKAISHYKIEEKNFVVVMVTKPKATPPPAPAQATTPASAAPEASAPAPAETPKSTPSATETAKSDEPSETSSTTTTTTESTAGTVTPSESSSTTTATESSQSQASVGTEMSTASGESALVTGQDYEMIVNRIVNMGFVKEDVQRALRASFNNPDRAVEYLCGGIPDMPAEAPPEAVPTDTNPAPAPAPAQQASAPSPAQPPAQPPTQAPAVQQLQAPPTAGGTGEDALAFLRSQPQFQHMRALIQNRPELLPELLQQIGSANPQLLQMISENQEQFISMLNEQEEGEAAQGGGEGRGGGAPGGSPGLGGGYIRITQQEKEAIERLKALGFSEGMCIQAYFACEKNEELAANYLLSHGEDDDS